MIKQVIRAVNFTNSSTNKDMKARLGKTVLTLATMLICSQLYSQQGYPKDYFRSPLDIPLYLSGNFGELRSNHFHTGIDIKTEGVEGKKIYAIADGYISRIKESPWGYGKVLYVDHPNGYTSVYAHLSEFSDEIEAFYKKVQYEKQLYILDLYPGPTVLPVKKGEVIALSGNSGSSGGPHLHFEIRETESEKPINPLLFGLPVKDNINPTIKGVKIYPYLGPYYNNGRDTLHAFGPAESTTATIGSGKNYRLAGNNTVTTGAEKIGLGIHSFDMLNGSGNICGIYKIELWVDSKLIFRQEMEKLNFYTNRYINTHMDYLAYRDKRQSYHRSFKTPNNQLEIYSKVTNNGIINIKEKKTAHVQYKVWDAYGNPASVSFDINHVKSKKPETGSLKNLFRSNEAINWESKGIQLRIPPGTLYEDLIFKYSTSDPDPGMHGPIHQLHTSDVPLQQYYTVRLDASPVPKKYREKAVIVSVNTFGRIYNEGGEHVDGWIETRTRSWGNYSIMIDTLKPRIIPLNISEGRNMSSNTEIAVKATDNLTGIHEYNGYIDGEWVLIRYNPKRAKYYYLFSDKELKPGKHTFKVVFKDGKENTSVFQCQFIR